MNKLERYLALTKDKKIKNIEIDNLSRYIRLLIKDFPPLMSLSIWKASNVIGIAFSLLCYPLGVLFTNILSVYVHSFFIGLEFSWIHYFFIVLVSPVLIGYAWVSPIKKRMKSFGIPDWDDFT